MRLLHCELTPPNSERLSQRLHYAVTGPHCRHKRRGGGIYIYIYISQVCDSAQTAACARKPFAALWLDSDTLRTSERWRVVCRGVIEKKNLLKAAGWKSKRANTFCFIRGEKQCILRRRALSLLSVCCLQNGLVGGVQTPFPLPAPAAPPQTPWGWLHIDKHAE